MQTECEPVVLSDAEMRKLLDHAFQPKERPPRDRKDEPPPPINPFVVIRYDASDIGVRPPPGGAITYLSPDILVTSLSGAPNIIADQPHLLQARLSNFGLFPASSVPADFYWANPSMAITETSVNFIGSGVLPYLPAGSPAGPSSLLVDCASHWVPRFENGGHECLLVRATIPVFDSNPVPLDPGLTYRVGQRNLTVVQVAPGQSFQMMILVANIAPFTLPVQVFGGRLDLRQTQALLMTTTRSKSRSRQALHEGALNWRITADEPPVPLVAPSKLFAQRLLAFNDHAACGTGKTQRLWEHKLPAYTEQRVTVNAVVPQAAFPGTVYSLGLQQQLGPISTGGYGIVLLVRDH